MTMGNEFEFEIKCSPSYTFLQLGLKKGQEIKTEAGTMMYFDPTLELIVEKADQGKGGFFKSMKRMLAGETFFLNKYVANNNGRLGLAPPFVGDIKHIPMKPGETWVLFSGAYMAGSTHFESDTKFQGFKMSLFGGEAPFMMFVKCDAKVGDLFVAGLGALIEFELKPGEIFNVDNGHLVAIQPSIQMDIKRVGGAKATVLSGEGVVCQLTGPGKIIMQSRNPNELSKWLYAILPKPQNSGSGTTFKLG